MAIVSSAESQQNRDSPVFLENERIQTTVDGFAFVMMGVRTLMFFIYMVHCIISPVTSLASTGH